MRNLIVGITSVLAFGCGPNGRPDGDNPEAPDAAVITPTADAPPVTPTSRVYAHSGNKLFQVNTQTLVSMEIGTMSGLGTQSLTDLAIDKNDRMLGITLDKLYSIDATTGTTTLVKDLSTSAQGFTSLSFVPMDINNPSSSDILVSANSLGEVYKIDTTTGTATMLGDFGTQGTNQIGSSGDLIGVQGFGIYATVNLGTSASSQDYLARIDPATWHATPIGGGTGFNDIFGLAYWDGKIYGFVSMGTGAGKIITIDPGTGAGTEVLAGAVRWYGAGVATDASIIL
jgi:hypothetical protein